MVETAPAGGLLIQRTRDAGSAMVQEAGAAAGLQTNIITLKRAHGELTQSVQAADTETTSLTEHLADGTTPEDDADQPDRENEEPNRRCLRRSQDEDGRRQEQHPAGLDQRC